MHNIRPDEFRRMIVVSTVQYSTWTTEVDFVLMTRSVPPGSLYICRLELRPAVMAVISSMLGTFLRPP